MLGYRRTSRDHTVKPRLPHDATQAVAVTGGRKLRPARWTALCHDIKAVVALEYAAIAGVMVLVVFTVSGPFGTALAHMFTNIANQL